MNDRYRSLVQGYRRPAEASAAPTARMELDPQRAEVLLACVRRLLEEQAREPIPHERRRSFRRPYPSAMLLTPCRPDKDPLLEETQTVVAKDLTPGSIGFVHTRALRDRHAVLTFLIGPAEPICLLTAIRRVQPIRQGLYLIGGEFEARISLGEFQGPAHAARP